MAAERAAATVERQLPMGSLNQELTHGWSAFGGACRTLDWRDELGRAPRTVRPLVSLPLARGEVPVVLALRFFLPESWTSKRARLERAGVPAEYRTARTNPEMALAEIDRATAAGVRFRCVLADAGSPANGAWPTM